MNMKKKTDKQLLIEKFCVEESINWPREMKLLATLLKQEPIEFWQFLVLERKIFSLSWLKTADGKQEIKKQKKVFSQLQTKKSAPVQENYSYERQTTKKTSLKDRLIS